MASSKFDAELATLGRDPNIPFRASKTHLHHTWARTFHSRPELYIRPQSLEEIQQVVTLARKCRRRIVVVGCGHSPSDLTCTTSWMVSLDKYNKVMGVDKDNGVMLVQGGIRLRQLNDAARAEGLTMPNLGSIDQQSIVGAISTATHGSTLFHGLMSESVRSLTIVLGNGSAVRCSKDKNPDLFRAALVSLGLLGIIVEVEFQMDRHTNIEWTQTLKPLDYVLSKWDSTLWTQKEFTRVWWCPYMHRAIIWSAQKTSAPLKAPVTSWYGGSVGFHTYHILLWLSNYVPRILPFVEWFVFGMQYGFSDHISTSAIEEQRTGLLMNCLYSQFVNEWALPLEKGPEAITRLSAWIHGDQEHSGIPVVKPKGLYVHCPIEVRVSDSTRTENTQPRPFLDSTNPDGPTVYLNATLYRPYHQDPPCHEIYYKAFEWLMKSMGGKPHWAKNFATVSAEDIRRMYGENIEKFLRVREEVDPEGMFVGEWHRRYILGSRIEKPVLPLEEREVARRRAKTGGVNWYGEQARPKSASSEESFDIMAGAEAEASALLPRLRGEVESVEEGGDEDLENEEKERGGSHVPWEQTHGNPTEGWSGKKVFDKM